MKKKLAQMMIFGFVLCLLSQVTVFASSAAAAEIKGYMWQCKEKKQLCWWHQAVVAPPRGWIVDDSRTQSSQALVMFENGDDSRDKPFMYVRTHNGDKDLELDTYIRGAQERWRKVVPSSSIEPLADVERAGKPTLKVFLYKNPSVPDQAFELTAFMKDVDSAHPQNTFFFQAVLAAPTLEELERAKPAFYDLLGRL